MTREQVEALIQQWRERAELRWKSRDMEDVTIGNHICTCANELEALLDSEITNATEAPEPPQMTRLQELAIVAALHDHGRACFVGTRLAQIGSRGHVPPFDTCPHPDCVLVRSVPSTDQEPSQ